MPLNSLTLHTRLTVGSNGNVKHIEVSEIALALLNRFPDRFLTGRGTRFIRKEFGGLPREYKPLRGGMSGFWQALYEAGIARRHEIQTSGRGYHRFAYEIVREMLQDYEAPAKMPTERHSLLETFAEFRGLPLDEVIEMSRTSILDDAGFRRAMEIAKQVSDAEYAKCGGFLYDRLLYGEPRASALLQGRGQQLPNSAFPDRNI